jgi:hypothetical protein
MSSSDEAFEARPLRARTASKAKRQRVLASDSESNSDTVEVDKGDYALLADGVPMQQAKAGLLDMCSRLAQRGQAAVKSIAVYKRSRKSAGAEVR